MTMPKLLDRPAERQPTRPRTYSVAAIVARRELLLVVAMIAIVIASTAAHPYFWSRSNISFILADSMVVTFLALGETFVMLTRGIDLSIAPMMGLSAVIVGFRIQDHGMTLLPAIGLATVVGLVGVSGVSLIPEMIRRQRPGSARCNL